MPDGTSPQENIPRLRTDDEMKATLRATLWGRLTLRPDIAEDDQEFQEITRWMVILVGGAPLLHELVKLYFRNRETYFVETDWYFERCADGRTCPRKDRRHQFIAAYCHILQKGMQTKPSLLASSPL